MKIFFKVFMLLFSLVTPKLFAEETLASNIVAVVNEKEISQEDVNEFVVKSIPGATFESLDKRNKKSVINQMIERKLFLEDAKKTNIESNPEFVVALRKLKENLILDFWMKDRVEEIYISEVESKAYYHKNSRKFYQDESVRVRHILVATKVEAFVIINDLLREEKNLEEKFIALAKEKSTGPSKLNGGELDWFVKEQMVPEFSDASFGLKIGEITKKPILTQFGYHIIYLINKKKSGLIPFKEVKNDIVKVLRMKYFKTKLDNLSKKLKKTADIIVK